MATNNGASFQETYNGIVWAIQGGKVAGFDEKGKIDFFKMTYNFFDKTIHEILLVDKNAEKEEYVRKFARFIAARILPFVNREIDNYNSKRNSAGSLTPAELTNLNDWLDIEDDFYSIVAMRSLYHFAHYMERDDADADKVWYYIMDSVMGGIFYYANKMILEKKFQHLIKQCPTGYG